MKCNGCGRHLTTEVPDGMCSVCREIRGEGKASIREEVRRTMPQNQPKPIPPHLADAKPKKKPKLEPKQTPHRGGKGPFGLPLNNGSGEIPLPLSQVEFFEYAAKVIKAAVEGHNLARPPLAFPVFPSIYISKYQFEKLNPPTEMEIPEGTTGFVCVVEDGDYNEKTGQLSAKLKLYPHTEDGPLEIEIGEKEPDVPVDAQEIGTVKDVKEVNPEPSDVAKERAKAGPPQPCDYTDCNSNLEGKCSAFPAIYDKCKQNPKNKEKGDAE